MENPYQERYRPQYHFTSRQGWLNDPNGLVYYRGEYHLFFQHNPFGNEWGNMTWGHAASPDLVHWKQLANALEPDRSGTMFSGSAVVDEGNTAGFQKGNEKTLVAIYTAAGGTSPESQDAPFTQCIAYSNDRGDTWTKYDRNPVLGHIVKENRDPKVEWHAPTRRWIMALYLDGSDFALFASADLKKWSHLQTFAMPGCSECPDFFELPVGDAAGRSKWVFTAANGHYLIGEFDGWRFAPEDDPRVSNAGANFYAVQTFSGMAEGDGRRIQIAWMNGGKYPDMPFNQQMSFPCELRLRSTPEGLRLGRTPVREIAGLHEAPFEWSGALAPGVNPAKDLAGDLFDLRLEFEPGSADEVSLAVRGEAIRYRSADRTLSCLGRSARLEPRNGRIRLQILVDRTSLEVFGNDGVASLASCFLPEDEERGLTLLASGGECPAATFTAFPLRSAWT